MRCALRERISPRCTASPACAGKRTAPPKLPKVRRRRALPHIGILLGLESSSRVGHGWHLEDAMHVLRFWSRVKEAHHSSKVGQSGVRDQRRDQRIGGCVPHAGCSVPQGSESGAHLGDTGRYVYVDNFR